MITPSITTNITRYNPYFCVGVVLVILFVLWVFYGGKKYDFIGLAPLDPITHSGYTGSLYSWGNQTPLTDSSSLHSDPLAPPIHQIGPLQAPIQSIQPIQSNQMIEPQQDDQASSMGVTSLSFRDISVSEPMVDQVKDNVVEGPLYQNMGVQSSPKICVSDNTLLIDETPALPAQFVKENIEFKVVDKPKIDLNRRLPSKGERICCQTMERIYGVPFKSVWPSWLRNPETGSEMELDCFNDDLKIAVEYNGVQHYQWPNFTNQSYQQFMNQVRRDDLKKRICDRHGVYLITVPYNVAHEQIPEYITLYLPETIKNRIHEEAILQDIN